MSKFLFNVSKKNVFMCPNQITEEFPMIDWMTCVSSDDLFVYNFEISSE